MGNKRCYIWGIDGALDSTSVTIFELEGFKHLNTVNIQTHPETPLGLRLQSLRESIEDLKEKFPPYEVAIEGNFIHTSRFQSNKDIFMSLGAIRDGLKEIEPIAYQPKTMKLVIGGHGGSNKKRIERAVKLNFPHLEYDTDDDYDSIGVACAHMIKKHKMPWSHLEDIKGIVEKKKKKKIENVKEGNG